jgi:CxC1 like cysteine cluster associated with KDZ transposases
MVTTGLEKITLLCCDCNPAPLQLLNRGMFACAPIAPTLAVEFRILELVRELFVRMAPNCAAWCDSLESFLENRGYTFVSKVYIYNFAVTMLLLIDVVIRTPSADASATLSIGIPS